MQSLVSSTRLPYLHSIIESSRSNVSILQSQPNFAHNPTHAVTKTCKDKRSDTTPLTTTALWQECLCRFLEKDDEEVSTSQLTPSTNYHIHGADFTDPRLIKLLKTHHATVTDPSINVAGEQTYALDISALKVPNIQLWTIWSSNSSTQDSDSGDLLGCAALKTLDDSTEEIKSMHTVAAARGQGTGGRLVDKIVEEGRKPGLEVLYLETGSMDGFSSVRSFYKGKGFAECEPFGDYRRQENSVFMCRRIG